MNSLLCYGIAPTGIRLRLESSEAYNFRPAALKAFEVVINQLIDSDQTKA